MGQLEEQIAELEAQITEINQDQTLGNIAKILMTDDLRRRISALKLQPSATFTSHGLRG